MSRSSVLASLALSASALVAVSPASATAADAADAADAAAPAVAGSLVFVRDHDVWVARADGSSARAVTTDGTANSPYRSPSQATDGTIAAAKGNLIVRMRPSGRELNRIDPPALENSVGHPVDGVPAPAISPDGRHIAYTFGSYECPVGTICAARTVTGFTAATRLTASEQYGVSYYNDPYWLSNTRTVQGGGTGVTVNLQDLGHDPVRWFADSDTSDDWEDWEDLSDPAISPDGRFYAAVRGYDETTHIAWYTLNGDPRSGPVPAAPSRKCETSYDETLGGPTFSADGRVLAWQEGPNVWATTDPGSCTHQPQVYLTDASEPSFSAARYAVPAPELVAKPAVAGKPAVGKRLTARVGAWTPRPSSYGYQWLRNGKAIRGATKASYGVTQADARKRLSVTVIARGAGGSAKATSVAVKVKPRRR